MNNTQVDHVEVKKELDELHLRIMKLEEKEKRKSKSFNENNHETSFTESDSHPEKNKLYPSLLIVTLITMVLMTVYEVAKQELHPSITIWQSHFITIFFSGIIAPIGAYVAFKKIEMLRQKALSELMKRKKIEEKLRDYNEELEKRVQERTFELSHINEKLVKEVNMRRGAEEELRGYAEQLLLNKDLLEEKAEELEVLNNQLRRSEVDLRELNASKDKFFSILAHDLRSPFASVVGLSEFLSKEAEKLKKTEIKAFIKSIYQSSNTIFKLLENLLQWSLLQTGKMKFNPTEFKLNDLLYDIIDLFKFQAEKKSIAIITEFCDDIYVYSDKNMIHSVVRNILSNSIKFTNVEGRVVLRTFESDNFIIVEVEDNGIGISEEKLLNMFKIENTESEEGTNRERGSGLGLILCKDFIDKNNGEIWIESELGVGTKFRFSLQLPPTKPD